jgi:hypothetical protein
MERLNGGLLPKFKERTGAGAYLKQIFRLAPDHAAPRAA